MNTPILTIGIPTYNRPNSIQDTVRRLLPQLNENVVLKVYDNCSEIPVASLFSDEEKKQFVIVRNKVNIGGDANICGVIYNAETKWVWDLGDDDGPLPNAVETILHTINQYPEDILINFNSYLEKKTDSFGSLSRFCGYMNIFSNFLFISSGVYNRDKLKNYIQQYYIHLSSKIGQVIFILKYLEAQDGVVRFLSEEIIEHSVNVKDEAQDNIEGVTWSPEEFIRCSSVIFHTFDYKKKYLSKCIFKEIAREYIRGVFVCDLSLSKKLKLWMFVVRTVGLFNIIRYNSHTVLLYIFRYTLPQKIYNSLKRKAAQRIENENKKANNS